MLLFCDGMDNYTVSGDILKRWSRRDGNNWTVSSTGGPNSTACLTCTNNESLHRDFTNTAVGSGGRIRIAFWFKGVAPPSTQDLIQFWNYNQTLSYWQAALYVYTSGSIGLYCYGGYNNAITTTNICDNAWHHIEIELLQTTTGSTAGFVKIYIDGAAAGSMTGNSGNSTAQWPYTTITLRGIGSAISIDDFIVWDSQTTDGFNSSPLGIRYIETLRPNAPGNSTALTPYGAVANWDAVNDAGGHDADTTVVFGTTGADLYNYTNLSTSPTAISAVVLSSHVRADGAGTFNAANKALSGSTTQSFTPATIAGTSYKMLQNVMSVDPATGTAWTTTGVNNAQFGVEVV